MAWEKLNQWFSNVKYSIEAITAIARSRLYVGWLMIFDLITLAEYILTDSAEVIGHYLGVVCIYACLE
jgi:hypothetical protein